MSIPLDRLYHYVESLAKKIHSDNTIVSRFWPHGSKNINDLRTLRDVNTWTEVVTNTHLYCHDQEPLCFDYYQSQSLSPGSNSWTNLLKDLNLFDTRYNIDYFYCAANQSLLLHSEKRSKNLEKYQHNGLIDVYYWSHALLARDWYRYAQHIDFEKNPKKLFLIYNRAWSGTREYRLKFVDHLIDYNLIDCCQCSVASVDSGIYYAHHKFSNPVWEPKHTLENFFPINSTSSCSSADFELADYTASEIEVVLETLFDDDRLHLTEKILRPIACEQPFILAATHGSLQYLRDYGFKTYHSVWNEDYDNLVDPAERLKAIVELMTEIANWSDSQRYTKLQQAQEIARYNKQWFFSEEFFDLTVNELKTNLHTASKKYWNTVDYSPWLDRWNHLLTYPEIQEFLDTNTDPLFPTRVQLQQIFSDLNP